MRTGVPTAVEWRVMNCLAKQGEERYQSSADPIVDLGNAKMAWGSRMSTASGRIYGSSRSMPPAPSEIADSLAKGVSKRRFGSSASVATFVGLLLVGVVIGFQLRGPGEAPLRPHRTFPLKIPGVSEV